MAGPSLHDELANWYQALPSNPPAAHFDELMAIIERHYGRRPTPQDLEDANRLWGGVNSGPAFRPPS